MAENKVRIHDVAALAGVSVGSASRVLNRAANVSPALRERVERAMAVLRYQPSYAARALRSRSSMTIGVLLSDVMNPLYARSFRAFEESFREDGYMLLLANGLNDPKRELDSLKTYQARGMDGVIYAPGFEQDPALIALVDALEMPVVLYDREMPGKADAVLFDHVNGICAACARLFELGHSRIALALWEAESRPVRQRIEGYRIAHRRAGLEPDPALILRQPTAISPVADELRRLLERADPPTALIAQGTQILVSALGAIARTGRRVPDDFSVVSIGDTDFTQTFEPTITALRTPSETVARQVKSLLLSRLRGEVSPSAPSRQVIVPYELLSRSSWGPLPRR